MRQDPSHQVRRRPDRRLASSQSMRCFYSYLAPLFLFLSWSPSRSVPFYSSSSSCDENGFPSSRIPRMCSSRVGSSSLMQDSRKCSSRVGSSSFMKSFQKCSPRVGSVQCPSLGFVLCPPREFFHCLVRRIVECLPRGFHGSVLHGLVLYRMVPRFFRMYSSSTWSPSSKPSSTPCPKNVVCYPCFEVAAENAVSLSGGGHLTSLL